MSVAGESYVMYAADGGVIVNRGSAPETNLRMPLLLFADDEADTFVFIDPGPQRTDRPGHHCWDLRPTTETQLIPHRIHSQKLLDTGSTVLKDLFRPRVQARVRKRYGLTNEMPPGIKYAIDLTPPSEGEEAVIFMTELSCPIGVRKWASLRWRWNLPLSCVNGQDEMEPVPATEPNAASIEKNKENQGIENETERDTHPPPASYSDSEKDMFRHSVLKTKDSESPKGTKKAPELPLDYSPTRHRTCLERVLHALEGMDPKLDTAPKLWTYFALAKLFQVATHPAVGDRILVWLYTESNSLFVEFNPELAYQISCGLQNRKLCQDSFAILVGEEALLLLESAINGTVPKRAARTIHGRTRETLDDTEIQRVEYASKAFLDRILNEFIKLAGAEMQWVEQIVTHHINYWSLDISAHRQAVGNLIAFCKKYVRSQIYRVLIQQYDLDDELKANSTVEYPGTRYHTAQSVIPFFCRILTRTFWESLRDALKLSEKYSWYHNSVKDLAPSVPNLQNQGEAIIQDISKNDIDEAISEFLSSINNTETRASGEGEGEVLPSVYFDFTYFQGDVTEYLRVLGSRMKDTPDYELKDRNPFTFGVQFECVDALVCLGDEEYKFLPLWAGGYDDGTGGVFVDQTVPLAEEGGFSTAGPSVHLAGEHDNLSSLGSFESINPEDAASTVQRASHEATDSHATTSVMSAQTSESEFELVAPVRDMDLKSSTSSSVAASDKIGNFDVLSDDDGFEDFDDNIVDVDDDDTVGTSSDREDISK